MYCDVREYSLPGSLRFDISFNVDERGAQVVDIAGLSFEYTETYDQFYSTYEHYDINAAGYYKASFLIYYEGMTYWVEDDELPTDSLPCPLSVLPAEMLERFCTLHHRLARLTDNLFLADAAVVL